MNKFIDRCPYSPTSWAWWEPWGLNGRCTCEPASVDTRQMAETGNTDSVRSTGGAVGSEADETPKGHRP